MEKLTLTRKEAAELLGISTATVTQWVMEGRLKAYRMNNKPKSPYLFTRENCMAALKEVTVLPRTESNVATKSKRTESTSARNKRIDEELERLLKTRKKGRHTE